MTLTLISTWFPLCLNRNSRTLLFSCVSQFQAHTCLALFYGSIHHGSCCKNLNLGRMCLLSYSHGPWTGPLDRSLHSESSLACLTVRITKTTPLAFGKRRWCKSISQLQGILYATKLGKSADSCGVIFFSCPHPTSWPVFWENWFSYCHLLNTVFSSLHFPLACVHPVYVPLFEGQPLLSSTGTCPALVSLNTNGFFSI